MIKVFCGDIFELKELIDGYKKSIGEGIPTQEQLENLNSAIKSGDIVFFVCYELNKPAGMCSVSRTYSTFNFSYSGVFEDFYVCPQFRGRGIAKSLVDYVFKYCHENAIRTLWVGCSSYDIEMYKHLGFKYPLGQLLTWSGKEL